MFKLENAAAWWCNIRKGFDSGVITENAAAWYNIRKGFDTGIITFKPCV